MAGWNEEMLGGVNPISADGDGALTTADNDAVTLVAHPGGDKVLRRLVIHNTGANALLWSADGGINWVYHPANFSESYPIRAGVNIQAKNAVAGSDLSGVYRSAY